MHVDGKETIPPPGAKLKRLVDRDGGEGEGHRSGVKGIDLRSKSNVKVERCLAGLSSWSSLGGTDHR